LIQDDGLRGYTELALLLLAAAQLRPKQRAGKVVDAARSRRVELALGQRRAAMLAPPHAISSRSSSSSSASIIPKERGQRVRTKGKLKEILMAGHGGGILDSRA
jgi:hypothetical protein